MIMIKHGHKPEPKRWKFKCGCGCECIADETEVDYIYSYHDVCTHIEYFYHAMCSCPDCEHNVVSERRVDADEYEKLLVQTDPSTLYKIRHI
jgi:hypothetical protein